MDEKKLKAGIKCHSAESKNQVNGCDGCPYDENDPMLDPRIDPDYGRKVLEKCAKCRDELLDDCIEYIATLEERIAIMEEGGWHDAEKDPPKKSGKYFVFDENEDILKLEYDECIDNERWGFWEEYFDMETLGSMGSDWKPYPLKVLYWMIMPEPPKEGEAEWQTLVI